MRLQTEEVEDLLLPNDLWLEDDDDCESVEPCREKVDARVDAVSDCFLLGRDFRVLVALSRASRSRALALIAARVAISKANSGIASIGSILNGRLDRLRNNGQKVCFLL